jgi:peptide/nickel transport system substrate-binding protein
VSEAIEREDIRKLIYKGRAAAASGPVSRSNKAWFNQSLEPLRFDPEGAVRRLERAGFRKQGSRLVDGSGAPVEFSIVTAANKTRERMAAMIQQDLGRIGIRVNIVPLDFASLLDRMTRSLDYEACLLALTNVETDPNGQMNIWMSSAPNHQWNPAQKSPATAWEAEIDRLMLAQSASADAARRKSHFDRVQKIVVEQMPMIYLVNRNALSAASPALRSLRPSVLNPFLLWNIDEIYWMPGRPPETATGGGGL